MVQTIVSADSNTSTAQILLDSAQEILGAETIQKVIQHLAPQDCPSESDMLHTLAGFKPSQFIWALEDIYGKEGGRGLALRIGRAAFKYGLKRLGGQNGLQSMQFRLQPAPRRLGNGLQILAQAVAEKSGSQVTVLDEGTHWIWRKVHEQSPNGKPQHGRDCYLIAGLLQGFTAWASGGRFYQVVEMECQSAGGLACAYRIEKRPLD